MGKRKKIIVKKDGTKVVTEGSASPQLLPENLRNLPSEIVTTNDSDTERAHPLDPQHVVEQYKRDHARKIREAQKPKRLFGDLRDICKEEFDAFGGKFCQGAIDWIIMATIYNTINGNILRMQRGEPPQMGPYYIWFHNPNFDIVSVHRIKGRGLPADADRPKHLRGLNLVVDLFCWPRRCVDKLREKGFNVEQIKDLQLKAKIGNNKIITLH